MKTRPIIRRLILAALLSLALILSLAGLIISSSRDPILGTWNSVVDHRSSITFRPDGTCTQPAAWGYAEGTWRAIPGPYYTRNPSAEVPLPESIGQFIIRTDYISARELTPERLQQALAQNAIQLTPASSRVRLYECDFPLVGLFPDRLSAPSPVVYEIQIALEDEDLFMATTYHRYQRGNWFTRTWTWIRSLLPP